MDMYSPSLISEFVYIIVIIFCSVAATLYTNRALKIGEPISKTISAMMVSLLLYTAFEMIIRLTDYSIMAHITFIVLACLSDFCFFAFVFFWLVTTILITGNPYIINLKGLAAYTIVYAALIETINVLYSTGWVGFGLDAKAIEIIALCINLVFDGTIFLLSLFCLIYAVREMREQISRPWAIGSGTVQCLYMIYIICWDCSFALHGDNREILYKTAIDPILIVYLGICLIVIWLLWKKRSTSLGFNIASTIGITEDNAEKWGHLSEKYKLTMREVEVSQLVCQGMSNPDIAEKLFISESTVKRHLNNIYKKTGRKGRYELMNLAK